MKINKLIFPVLFAGVLALNTLVLSTTNNNDLQLNSLFTLASAQAENGENSEGPGYYPNCANMGQWAANQSGYWSKGEREEKQDYFYTVFDLEVSPTLGIGFFVTKALAEAEFSNPMRFKIEQKPTQAYSCKQNNPMCCQVVNRYVL